VRSNSADARNITARALRLNVAAGMKASRLQFESCPLFAIFMGFVKGGADNLSSIGRVYMFQGYQPVIAYARRR